MNHKTMKKILLPTDFSPTAKTALTYATHLSKQLTADIHLLHTYDLPRASNLIKQIEQSLITEAQKSIDEESARVNTLGGGYASTNIRKGNNAETIGKEAQKTDTDLIIMGTKGASGLKEIFFGSNTVNAIKYTEKPMIVVPENTDYQTIKKILFAADSNFFSKMEALEPLKILLKKTGAQLIVLHLDNNSSPVPFRLLLNEHFGKETYEFQKIKRPDIYTAIMEHSSKINADMVCVIHNYRNFLDQLFHTSTTYKTAFYTDVPLLILKN